MGSTTTQTTIANRALQILGSPSISDIKENTIGAKAMNRAYEPVLLTELRQNYWSFAIKRATLPADAVPPIFGKANYFTLPGDFLCEAPPDQVFGLSGISGGTFGNLGANVLTGSPTNDWQFEGGKIASNQSAPLFLRYVSSEVTESMFDPCFCEAFSCALALMCCEQITQSNTKLQNIGQLYDDAIEIAKKRNAFEGRPVQPPADSYLVTRF